MKPAKRTNISAAWRAFAEFAELRTKVSTVLLFFYLPAYFALNNWSINLSKTSLFFTAALIFDCFVTMFSNWLDAQQESGAAPLPLAAGCAKLLLLVFFLTATGLGLVLVYLSDAFVLFLGVFCFSLGLAYSWGRLSISRLPLGELLSALAYGVLIPLLFFYLNLPAESFIFCSVAGGRLALQFELANVLRFALLAITPFACTWNLMLANNLCDLEQDKLNGRLSLPIFLGRKHSLLIFRLVTYAPYAALVLMLSLRLLPPLSAVFSLTLPWVYRHEATFQQLQDKSSTFTLSIRNFVLIVLGESLAFMLATIVKIRC